jgi:hypothetical protein
MRRTALIVVAVLTLAVVFTAPAAAEPDQNPGALTWQITCPVHGAFVAMSPFIVPGWVEGSQVPVLLMGGTFTEYPNGLDEPGVLLGTNPAPRGLMGRLEQCTLGGPLEADPFEYWFAGNPVWMFFPGV